MPSPTPYLHFAGHAREALAFYADVFGGSPQLYSFADFDRTDGPPELVAHGALVEGPVDMFAADASGDEPVFAAQGLMLSLLGIADPETLREWFTRLAEGGEVLDDLQPRPWGACDGQLIDRYGIHWLIGYEGDAA